VAEVPHELFDRDLYYSPERGGHGTAYSKLGAVLANREFDHVRCPISEPLLKSVDRTHLLMTGVAADALRHGGLNPFHLQPSNTAVFIGHSQGSRHLGELTYSRYLEEAADLLDETAGFQELDPESRTSIEREWITRIRRRLPKEPADLRNLRCNMVAGTIAKAFGLTGPWLALNSACASSVHAMLLGARALQLGRAEMAIVGGAADFKVDSLVLFSQAQALSDSGSRPFDADADGLILSEGYVALVMKTLDRALSDGDPIQAIVRGLGVASDGRGKSLWAPRKEGQMKAMQRAYRGGVDMSALQYLEAHATSTSLGDATELQTLGEVLGPLFPAGKKIPITSVKANIGHTLEAAGIAGVIKTVLCMQHRTFPPAINVRTLNPKIDWRSAPYYIPLEPEPWETPAPNQPRRAAVNAFGVGGLNMHVVLDEFTESARSVPASRTPTDSAEEQGLAIVGMGCIFPGAANLSSFWELLIAGGDPKSVPAEGNLARTENTLRRDPAVRPAGYVTGFEYDWRKYHIPPKQIAGADPLQFMLLDGVQQALADAGYDRKPLEREKCGVVVGTEFGGDFCDHLEMGLRLPEMQRELSKLLAERGFLPQQIGQIESNYSGKLLSHWPSLKDDSGSFTSSTLASRISRTLDLAGGALAIDSGSTSALSGLAICWDMLFSGDNDLMICAAGQKRMSASAFQTLAAAGLLSDSAMPANLLDAAYEGIVPGEGVGVVIVKRLADARRDGDRIHAVIRGIGVAHHESAAESLRLAAERSSADNGIDLGQITLAELDTDERLGAEGHELQTFIAAHRGVHGKTPLTVSSLTSQFGHLGGAAGMAGLIKASLEVERGQVVPTLDVRSLAPALNTSDVRLARQIEPLPGRRLAAVASWSNGLACHVILEEPTPAPARRLHPTVEPAREQVNGASPHASTAPGDQVVHYDATERRRMKMRHSAVKTPSLPLQRDSATAVAGDKSTDRPATASTTHRHSVSPFAKAPLASGDTE
jgi:acyl transferase domain-containing protein